MIVSSVAESGAKATVLLTSLRAAAMYFAKCSATRGAAARAPPYRAPLMTNHCRLRSRMTEPFELLETIKWTPAGGFFLLDRHLRRMNQSAAYFSYRCSIGDLRARLDRAVAGSSDALRVRLLLAQNGDIRVECTPLGPGGPAAQLGIA